MELLTQLRSLISSDDQRMHVLRIVNELKLPDCWVSAGFVRSCVWDHLHERPRSPLRGDVDVVWHDPSEATPERDAVLESILRARDDTLEWSVKNQARMHVRNGDQPYSSASDAMRHWPETATAVGVRLDEEGNIDVVAPYGLVDLFALVVRPTERFMTERQAIYADRVHTKRWQAIWPRLSIDMPF